MLQSRWIRSLAALGAVVVLYFAYALLAVPLIEPALARSTAETNHAKSPPRPAGSRTLAVLQEYFRPAAWQLESPKLIQSERVWFLFRDYKNLPDGRVELSPFCLLIFPKPKETAAPGEPAEAIVMEALQGAVLKFDEPFELRTAKIGKLVGGQLVGPVTIQSSPPSPTSDLAISTRDIKLADNRLFTEHAVDFRLGPNRGSGRRMQMVLAMGESTGDGPVESTIAGLDSFELERDVKMRIELGGRGLLSSDRPPPRGEQAGPPVEITCQGAFRFDMPGLVATFNDQVDVVRLNDSGESDQLNCEKLSIFFQSKDAAAGRTPGKPSGSLPADLTPKSIQARGEPVVVRAPSSFGHARCQVLEYEIDSGRITLKGGEEVLLHQGTNEIRSRQLDYEPDQAGGLGKLSAAGPGWLQGALADNPAQKYQAVWTEELRLRPFEQFQIVSLIGGATMRYSSMGDLSADEIHVWLADAPPARPAAPAAKIAKTPLRTVSFRPETSAGRTRLAAGDAHDSDSAGAGARSGPAAGPFAAKVRPVELDRMLAQGSVRLDAPQMTGAVDRMEVRFARAGGSPGNGQSANAPSQRSDVTPWADLGKPIKTASRYRVQGDTLKVQLSGSAAQPKVSGVELGGGATLVEQPGNRDLRPLVIKGDAISVARADEPDAAADVVGKPAYIEARGLTLVGPHIEMEQKENRLSVSGAGRMTLPGGKALAAQGIAGNVEITWQRGMEFDGRTATFERSVLASAQHQSLATDWLSVTLDRRIDFGDTSAKGQANPTVQSLEARGEMTLENRSFDERGQVSIDRLRAADATINRSTGAIAARGPGWIQSVRRGKALRLPASGKQPAGGNEDGLNYLLVTFEREISGNIDRREMTFSDGVRSVYGPIADWRDELNMNDPDNLDENSVLLTADQLTVRQSPSPVGNRSAAELETLGNTVVEGRTFSARAHRMSYTEAKDQLILQGTNTLDAELFRQAKVDGPVSHLLAHEIRFWPGTNNVQLDGVRSFSGDLPAAPTRLPRKRGRE